MIKKGKERRLYKELEQGHPGSILPGAAQLLLAIECRGCLSHYSRSRRKSSILASRSLFEKSSLFQVSKYHPAKLVASDVCPRKREGTAFCLLSRSNSVACPGYSGTCLSFPAASGQLLKVIWKKKPAGNCVVTDKGQFSTRDTQQVAAETTVRTHQG